MKKAICIAISLIFLAACSVKMEKSQLLAEMSEMNFCEGIACEKGLIVEENLNKITFDCFEKVTNHLPNEITTSDIRDIEPDFKRCVESQMDFVPLYPKEKLLYAVKDNDQYSRFSKFEPKMSRLDFNNLIAGCYEEALRNLPSVITFNQFKTTELEVEKCVHNNIISKN